MSEKRPWTPGKWLYYDDGVGGCRNIIHADIGDFVVSAVVSFPAGGFLTFSEKNININK